MRKACSPLIQEHINYSTDDLEKILCAICRRIIELGLNQDKIFTTSGPLKDEDYIHINSLYGILVKLNVSINIEDFSVIVDKYGTGSCLLNKKKFTQDLNEVKPSVVAELQKLKEECIHSYPDWQCSKTTKELYKYLKEPVLDYNPLEIDQKPYCKEYSWNWDENYRRWKAYEPMDDLATVMSRIQKHVFLYNLVAGLEDYFSGFDKLHSGKISHSNFLQGLDQMGISECITGSTGLVLRSDEIKAVLAHFIDVKKRNLIDWRRFVNDIRQGIESKHASNALRNYTNVQHRLFRQITSDEAKKLQFYMALLMNAVKQKRLNILPFFEQYDKLRSGYVTKSQFIRAMCQSCLPVDLDNGDIIYKYYSDVKGFDYTRFLPDLGLNEELRSYKQQSFSNTNQIEYRNASILKEKVSTSPPSQETNEKTLRRALEKIRHAVETKGIKLSYFLRPFDKLNHGVLERSNFERGLSSSGDLKLSQEEIESLMNEFQATDNSEFVNTKQFIKAVEESQYKHEKYANIFLEDGVYSKYEFKSMDETWKKIIKLMRGPNDWDFIKRMDPVSFGTVKTNHVTRNCYYRILRSLGIMELLSDREKELLFKVFQVQLGNDVRFDVAKFLRAADVAYWCSKHNP